eukprot:TRINITY_DN67761_c1_g1_i10.p1 TRINITY_DN67761_c1_g1~~TRINITY_DN67761_c1_g1_i10.p1  ORF type:complete len:105 (+),score=6.95 TRINITY_DN67761_c1_g1_i10:135-449(+)
MSYRKPFRAILPAVITDKVRARMVKTKRITPASEIREKEAQESTARPIAGFRGRISSPRQQSEKNDQQHKAQAQSGCHAVKRDLISGVECSKVQENNAAIPTCL